MGLLNVAHVSGGCRRGRGDEGMRGRDMGYIPVIDFKPPAYPALSMPLVPQETFAAAVS